MPSPSTLVYVSGLISPDAVTTEVRSSRVTAAVWTVTTSLLICRIVNHAAPARTAAPPTPIPIFCHIFMCWGLGLLLLQLRRLTLVLRREPLRSSTAADSTSRHTTDGGRQANDLRIVFEGVAQTFRFRQAP